MSKLWQIRPSSILNISDPVVAYDFDRAVMHFGQALERDIEESTRNAKGRSQADRIAKSILDRWLDDDQVVPEEPKPPQEFRDPAEIFAARKRMRENGEL